MFKDDPDLSRLLGSWRHQPVPAPRFNAQVWGRIAAARDGSWALAAAVGRWLGLSAGGLRWATPAAAMLALAGLLGAGAGHWHAVHNRTERMAAAYVRTIDPLQMTAATAPEP